MKNVIYKIRNVVNDNFYVGSTTDTRVRFQAHKRRLKQGKHQSPHMQAAWNKYGEDCFKFEVVEIVESPEDLHEAEQRWLDENVGKPHCYNLAVFADAPMRGRKHTPETLAKIAANRIPPSGENHYRYGKTVSEETRKKIGDTQRGKSKGPGRTVSPEGMAKIRAAAEAGHYSHWEGRNHTEESRDKMGRAIVAITPVGAIMEFATITKLRQALKLTSPTVDRALKSGKPLSKGKCAGWAFCYKENYNYDIAFPDGRGPQ